MDCQTIHEQGQLSERIDLSELSQEHDELLDVDGLLEGADEFGALVI